MTEYDYDDVIETASYLIYDLLYNNPSIYSQTSFHEYLLSNTIQLIEESVTDLELNDSAKNLIENAVEDAILLSDGVIAPTRSYFESFTDTHIDVSSIALQIQYLRNVPQPEQRTNEWYHFRHRYLTASSIWKAFGSDKMKNELIYNKCKPIDVSKYDTVNMNSPMHWGQKYEPVSVEYYEKKFNTKVSDFGCLPHKTIPYIAASPDGINTEPSSSLYGRMLEVKNIVNREINGIPKHEYWIQMQLQMEVCELDDCDFLETRFIEYDSYDEFIQDGEYTRNDKDEIKGFIICFNENGRPLYEYAPLGGSIQDHAIWETETLLKHDKLAWINNIFWRMSEVSCVLVKRNNFWFKSVLDDLNSLWGIIESERKTGYEHRAPNKKPKVINKLESKCLINVDNEII